MSAIDRIKAHLETTDLKDKLATLKEEDLEDMMFHINDKAQKEAINGVACIEDNDVFGWAYEWVMNFNPSKPKKEQKEVKSKPKAKDKSKPAEKPKKAEIKPKKSDIKVKQTDLFGWEK